MHARILQIVGYKTRRWRLVAAEKGSADVVGATYSGSGSTSGAVTADPRPPHDVTKGKEHSV
jgi:hypothetical protein